MKLWLHARGGRHKRWMIEAESAVNASYHLTANGDPLAGWDKMRRATNMLAGCGCPSSLWPETVREAVTSTSFLDR